MVQLVLKFNKKNKKKKQQRGESQETRIRNFDVSVACTPIERQDLWLLNLVDIGGVGDNMSGLLLQEVNGDCFRRVGHYHSRVKEDVATVFGKVQRRWIALV